MKLLTTFCLSLCLLLASLPVLASPVAPTLSLSAPSAGLVDDVVLIDARASAGVYNKPQSNGTYSFTMDFGDGTPLVYIMASGHAYRDAGTYTIRINGKSSAGEAATEVTQSITISEIPAATGGGIQTLTDTANLTTNATNLQNALNTAASANTAEQEIVLPNDFDAKGPITMTATTGSKYITIKWSGLSALPHKKRVDPTLAANYPTMPTIFSPNNTSSIAPAITTPNPQTASVVKYYRWQGIHFARENNTITAGDLFTFGQDVYNGNDDLARQPHHLIVDRCWFDSGGISTATFTSSGLRIIGNYTSTVDSWIAYFRLTGTGIDVQGLVIAGSGPNYVKNNFISASSENMQIGRGAIDYRRAVISSPTTTTATLSSGTHYLPGGVSRPGGGAGEIASATTTENLSVGSVIALPSNSCANGGPTCVEMVTLVTGISGNNITYEAVPFAPTNGGTAYWSDVPMFNEVRNNYFYKPTQWRPFLADGTTANPTYDGSNTQVKNTWETKSCRYCVIDGNVLENTWYGAQPYAIVISVRNDTGMYSNAAAITDFQWSNNLLHNSNANFAVTQSDDGDVQTKVSLKTRGIFYVNNLSWNVGWWWDSNGPKEMLRLGGTPTIKLDRIFVMHNTFDGGVDGGNFYVLDIGPNTGGATNSMWFNNVHPFNYNGFRDSLRNPQQFQVENITDYLPPGSPTSWNKNLVVNRAFSSHYGTYAPMPATGIYVGGTNADGSSNVDTVVYGNQFVNYAAGDFTLAVTSPGKSAATDGTDVGVNYPAFLAATVNTVSGDFTGVVLPSAPVGVRGRINVRGRVTVKP